jgi:serine/threonine-protein kinase HipA
MKLNVFRGNVKAGSLDMLANEPFYGFTYDSEYLASQMALPLSLSLPLSKFRYSGIQAQPYFEGLLPEGAARTAIARHLGIPQTSSVKLLRALGRDCVGDISVIDEESGNPPAFEADGSASETKIYELFDGGILKIAESPHIEIPRLQEDMRLSLAGGQEKIALYHKNGNAMQDGWYIPMLGHPTTHIIKPGILESHYPQITLNEFLCVRAATECGIKAVDVDILFPDTPVIVISRYDRIMQDITVNNLNMVSRIHQEDCCQACGIISGKKYQHDGGPGFKQIRDLLLKHCRQPIDDIAMLVKWGIFNYLIGNCDAHAKNLSLLHNADGTISLAPAYDIISTFIYNGRFGAKLSRNMGMRIGMHENIEKVDKDDLSMFARDVQMRLNQIMLFADEIIQKLPAAFNAACLAAEYRGFDGASEIVSRIMVGCNQRAKILGL